MRRSRSRASRSAAARAPRQPCPTSRSPSTPGLGCLGGSQCPVTQAKESCCRRCEQEGADNSRYQAGSIDCCQEPETEHTEPRDEAARKERHDTPGSQIAVSVKIQGDFPYAEDCQEEACPYERSVLAAAESLGGEVAGHAVHSHSEQGKDHLSRERCAPTWPFGLDCTMGDHRTVSTDLREIGHMGALHGDVGRVACTQALIFHGLIGRVDVADQDSRVNGGGNIVTSVRSLSVTGLTLKYDIFWHMP